MPSRAYLPRKALTFQVQQATNSPTLLFSRSKCDFAWPSISWDTKNTWHLPQRCSFVALDFSSPFAQTLTSNCLVLSFKCEQRVQLRSHTVRTSRLEEPSNFVRALILDTQKNRCSKKYDRSFLQRRFVYLVCEYGRCWSLLTGRVRSEQLAEAINSVCEFW